MQVAKITCANAHWTYSTKYFALRKTNNFSKKNYRWEDTFKHNLYANLCNQIHVFTTFNGKNPWSPTTWHPPQSPFVWHDLLENPLVVAKKLKMAFSVTYMDVTMVVFHVFPTYKKTNKIKFIEIILKKTHLSKDIIINLSRMKKSNQNHG